MLDLGSTEFYLAIPSYPETELKRLSTSLFDSWEEYVDTALTLKDYSLLLQVEEGSVRGMTKIGAALGVFYMAIGNYGDFVSGVKTIGEQVEATSVFLSDHAKTVFSCSESNATTRRRGGDLRSLQNLFGKVQRGEISPEEATAKAEALLGAEADSEPGFLQDLESAFWKCPRHHQQQPFQFAEDMENLDSAPQDTPPKPRTPRSPQILVSSQQLRIEVWRESKKKKKHTRVFKT